MISSPISSFPQSEFEKFGEIISASISQGMRKKFPKKKPSAAEEDKKEETATEEGENKKEEEGEKKQEDKKDDAGAVVENVEGEKKDLAAADSKSNVCKN